VGKTIFEFLHANGAHDTISLVAIVATWRGLSSLQWTGSIRVHLDSSLSPLLCRFIVDHQGILSAFYFLAGTVIVANPIVMTVRE
jgi:hypothetical protein